MENLEVKKVFRSRLSVLLLCLILAALIPIALIPMHIPGLLIVGGMFLLTGLLLGGMNYVILEGKLHMGICGISLGSINIADIVSVERSYNPLSSPASSLKRLLIRSRKGAKHPFLLISPVREQEELKAINPDISVNVPVKKGL